MCFFRILSVVLLSMFAVIVYAQPDNPEPGKCYGKSRMPVPMKLMSEYIRVFNGDYASRVAIDSIYFYYNAQEEGLVYLGFFGELTLSQQMNEDKLHKVVEVTDPTETAYYELQYIEYLVPGEGKGKKEWQEVVCRKNQEEMMLKAADKLIALGYLYPQDRNDTGFIMDALLNYQIENRLPEGTLNMATLDQLNIKY